MNLKKLRYCILLLAFCFSSQAQIYPVQVNTALIPPYLTTVSDYSTTLNEKFVANLFTSDLTVSQRQIQLKLYIEGNNIQTTSTAIINGYQPLYLNGGESLRLTNVDLEAYFRLENLQGINPNVYGNSLPQGLYKFCIEVIDYNTQIKISQKSCAMAYFIVNDPPFLNLPSNHENIPSQDPQNIVFTWTPRHLNATNIEYEYTLVDLQDNQAPSNYAFVVTPPLFQATTNNTILLYGPSQPLLTIGKKYAWRVQAKTQSGFGDTAAFQNNGYSEIYDFVFQGNCDKPTFVLAEALSNSQVKITWQTNPNHLNYIVQYRKKDTNQWFDIEATTNEVKLYDLEPLAVYEFRVGGYCTGNVLTFSNTNEFTQPANNVNVVNCGISPDIDLSNQQLYSGNLGEGETFLAGDFPVHVTESTNASGTYSGKGWTKAPYLNSIRLAVLFTNVKLNTDKKMLAGEVKAVYDPTWSNIADINVIVDQVENVLDIFQQSNDVHTHSVPFVIGSATNITVVNGQIVVVNSATGQTGATYDHDTGEMTTITDANGNVYTVSPTGQVQQVGVGIGIPSATNTENVATNGSVTALSNVGIQVTFKKSNISGKESIAAEDKGFSSLAPAKIKALYKIIKDGQNADYPLYYKAIINAENGDASYEYVIAEIKITDNNIKIDSLIFNKKGVKVIAENLSNQGTIIRRLLKIPAFTTIGEEEVLALLKNGNQKQKVVGAMIAVPIKDVGAVNVTLIPVNGATITAATKTQLNAIYAGTGARLNTTIAANYSSTKTTLDCGSSGFFANYTSDQKAFIDAYKLANPAQSDQYYIFVTKNISPTGRQLNGFMPLHRQFGFVFSDQTTGNEVKSDDVSGLASVIAHELGHGAFELEHPWEKYKYTQGAGTTPWLMDYEKGTQIPFSDWQTISHPKTKLYIFQGDESGAQAIDNYNITDNDAYFLAPNGRPIHLPKGSKIFQICVDNTKISSQYLFGFGILNAVTWKYYTISNDPNYTKFNGYFQVNVNSNFRIESWTKDTNNNRIEYKFSNLSKNQIKNKTQKIVFIKNRNKLNTADLNSDTNLEHYFYFYEKDKVFGNINYNEINNSIVAWSSEPTTGLIEWDKSNLFPGGGCNPTPAQTNANESSNNVTINNLAGVPIDFTNNLTTETKELGVPIQYNIYKEGDVVPTEKLANGLTFNVKVKYVDGEWVVDTITQIGANGEKYNPYAQLNNMINACLDQKYSDYLTLLRDSQIYIQAGKYKKIAYEIVLKVYNNLFFLRCFFKDDGSVNANCGVSEYAKGLVFEIFETVDIVGIVLGTEVLVKQIAENCLLKETQFTSAIISITKKLVNGQFNITEPEKDTLISLLLPPCVTVESLKKLEELGKTLKAEFVKNPCYNSGRLTTMALPLIVTGGVYALEKIPTLLASVALKGAKVTKKFQALLKSTFKLKPKTNAPGYVLNDGDVVLANYDDLGGFVDDVDNLPVQVAGNWQKILTKLDNLELPNLKSKLNSFDEVAKNKFADDVANLSDDALKQLDDNFGLLDEWKQIDALSASAQASRKPTWLQKILDGNEFNRIRSSSYPNNEIYLVNPNDPSKYVRLDSYKPGQEIVSRKYTQFSEIQESTGVKYIQELKDKYSPGTVIANVPSNKVGGANSALQGQIGSGVGGQMFLEIPVQTTAIPQSVLNKADELGVVIRDVQGKMYN